MNADDYIKLLDLKKHPEGGYFKEVYRCRESFNLPGTQLKTARNRNLSTSIYFLLKNDEISTLHRIKSDELWHHYSGSSVKIIIINSVGSIEEKILGKDVIANESFQVVIPAGVWFCAELTDKKSFALVGCTVSPGFDFEDFELGSKVKLTEEYPLHKDLINRFTRV